MLQRLKVGDIVHPDDRAKAREFECPICLSVPSISVAVQSVCCNVIFCSDCLAPLGACPNCRADIPADGNTVALNPLVRRMLQNLKVFCPHHADAQTERPLATSLTNSSAPTNDSQATAGGGICTDKSQDGSSEHAESCCDWAGNYGDLLTKHIAECAYAEIDCPHGCGERFLRGQLSTHEEGCEKGYEECGICGVMVKIGGMAGHRAEAAEMHVKILEGERADLRAQVAEREAVQTKIDGVKADVRAVANELKTMNGDFVKLIGVNGLGPRVIWKVKTSEMFEQCTAKGDSFDSPEFSVGMLSKFVIRFLPVGSINSLDGKVGLYIMQTLKEMCFPGELEVVVSAVGNEFAAVSASYYWRTIFDDDGDYGTHSLMDRFAKDVGDRHQSPSRGRRQRSHHRIGR